MDESGDRNIDEGQETPGNLKVIVFALANTYAIKTDEEI